jgi:ATP-dependent helicase/nuclease subunit A
MVLARRRTMLGWMSRALRERGIAHVAAEDVVLADLPEARDLIALLEVMASPGHDLALAQVLKCPFFGASDDQLLALSQRAERGRDTWWRALQAWRDAPDELQRARDLLAGWAQASQSLPPHDLLDRMLAEGDLLARALAAAPPPRRDLVRLATEALLAQALAIEGGRYTTPYNLVRALRNQPLRVSARPRPDVVQLLTVHGAKGLEADIVFLLDTDTQSDKSGRATVLVDWPVQEPVPNRVAFVPSEYRIPPTLADFHAAELALHARESLNLLYVAITRARRQVVLSRTEPFRAGPGRSWWDRARHLTTPWTPAEVAIVASAPPPVSVPDLPSLTLKSRGASDRRPLSTGPQDSAVAPLGQAVHRVLEWACGSASPAAVDHARLAEAAALEFGLSPALAARVSTIALQVLGSPRCRAFFDPAGLAWAGNEVPLAHEGETLRIDRLVRLAADGVWWVLDYKLNTSPHQVPANVDQLRRYRDAVARLQPGELVRAAFITGEGEVVELPQSVP